MKKLDGEQWREGTCLGSSKDITERDGELLLESKVLVEETDPKFNNNTSSYIVSCVCMLFISDATPA
jgi:hypothetical protein